MNKVLENVVKIFAVHFKKNTLSGLRVYILSTCDCFTLLRSGKILNPIKRRVAVEYVVMDLWFTVATFRCTRARAVHTYFSNGPTQLSRSDDEVSWRRVSLKRLLYE